MSNKLTREVKYLQESDRPKKVEPLSFFDYSKNFLEPSQTTIEFVEWDIKLLNEYALKYSTYLQEFSAEEVGVEFTHYFNPELGKTNPIREITEYNDVTYIGADRYSGDMFCVKENGNILIYSGKLNSGRY